MLAVSRTYLQMPVLVHELVPGPIARPEPTLVNARARLYGVSVPPDLCNPRGCEGWAVGLVDHFMGGGVP